MQEVGPPPSLPPPADYTSLEIGNLTRHPSELDPPPHHHEGGARSSWLASASSRTPPPPTAGGEGGVSLWSMPLVLCTILWSRNGFQTEGIGFHKLGALRVSRMVFSFMQMIVSVWVWDLDVSAVRCVKTIEWYDSRHLGVSRLAWIQKGGTGNQSPPPKQLVGGKIAGKGHDHLLQ